MSVVWSMKLFNADAQKVYNEIEAINNKTPQNLVDYAAANPDSELHKCFTWNDAKAANEYRKEQARRVMQLLVFREDEKEETTHIRVMQKASDEYKPVVQIVRDKDEYKKLLARAKAELKQFRERYKKLVELEQILELIDEL